jgi:glycosyltransferase involved in cell wall biosynthesis
MEKVQLRVLVFGSTTTHIGSEAIVRALSPYVDVKEVNWHYKPIPNNMRYNFFWIFYRTFEFVYWSLRLLKEIYRFNADIIIAQYAYFTGFICTIAANLTGKLCVIRAVGSDLRIDSQSLLGKVIVSWAIKNVSGVICVSKDLDNIANAFGAKSTVVIPSPLDLSDFEEKVYAEKEWEIISVAILKPVKGMSYLINAMGQLDDNKLLIIGDGPERKNLESLSNDLALSERVLFKGWVDHSLVWDYLQRSKVFVLPSISEGCSRALREAMACGLPIVATNVGGTPEIVVDGINGFLVPPRNEQAMAEAVKKILTNNNLQKIISNENKTKSKEYTMTIIGQRIYEYLETMIISSNRD